MKKDDEKRLRKLTKCECFLKKLTYTDFIFLLEKDQTIRNLIRGIMGKNDDTTDDLFDGVLESISDHQAVITTAIKSPSPVKANSQQPLQKMLAPELTLLEHVKADAELARVWLGERNEDAGRELVRLIAIAAQWDQVLQLWDRLAERCKTQQRPATVQEREILITCLNIHNLIWQERQATLQTAECDVKYDYQRHERGVPTGDNVTAEWLPGISNAAGQLQKKPLVKT